MLFKPISFSVDGLNVSVLFLFASTRWQPASCWSFDRPCSITAKKKLYHCGRQNMHKITKPKLVKIRSANQSPKYGIAAFNLKELIKKGCHVLKV